MMMMNMGMYGVCNEGFHHHHHQATAAAAGAGTVPTAAATLYGSEVASGHHHHHHHHHHAAHHQYHTTDVAVAAYPSDHQGGFYTHVHTGPEPAPEDIITSDNGLSYTNLDYASGAVPASAPPFQYPVHADHQPPDPAVSVTGTVVHQQQSETHQSQVAAPPVAFTAPGS
ncbi:protein dissatisfaction-like [Schistocerca gregaria]|uniref:protein dissatisfaction-like n=1 Tax=Schistocerca gregaria TaxID=7010 RepID=UPI00211EFD71|nr:protein dissatisfaction-like [Schistocerca gregaria]